MELSRAGHNSFRQELRLLQEQDKTLVSVRQGAAGENTSAGRGFFKREGLIYRRWMPLGRDEEGDDGGAVSATKEV